MVNIASVFQHGLNINFHRQKAFIVCLDLCHKEHIKIWTARNRCVQPLNKIYLPVRLRYFARLCDIQVLHRIIISKESLNVVIKCRLWRARRISSRQNRQSQPLAYNLFNLITIHFSFTKCKKKRIAKVQNIL